MLAYVFWHRPRPGAVLPTYEARLRDFHAGLARCKLPGYRGSTTVRTSGLPWLEGSDIYEDWYLLDGSAGLDVLNEAAVAGTLGGDHEAVAQHAATGIAGLYRLRVGQALPAARRAWWLDKPDGMSYDELWRLAALWLPAGGGLWARQMTLGPTPELCLLAPAEAPVPGAVALAYERAIIGQWPA